MGTSWVFCCSSCISYNPASHLSESKNIQSNRKKYFSLMQLNISFLQYRLEEFSEVLKEINIKFNIACMTAVCLKKYPLTNIHLQNYKIKHNPADSDSEKRSTFKPQGSVYMRAGMWWKIRWQGFCHAFICRFLQGSGMTRRHGVISLALSEHGTAQLIS